MDGFIQFWGELRRRRVIRVVIAYLAVAWIAIEVASLLEEVLELPGWSDRLVFVILALGFPLALTLAWVFDITPDGIRRTNEQVESSITSEQSQGIAPGPPDIDTAIASVCVLPFDELGLDSTGLGHAEALAAEIHSTLRRMHRLRVASRRSSLQFRNSDKPIKEIARALNVRYVLSGSVVISGDKIKVIAELDDASTGLQTWSEKYERNFDDLLAVHADIAEAIVAAFGAERQRTEITQAQFSSTDNLDAWSLVQRARHYILDYTRESLDEALALQRRGLALDPDYAAAHAGLASVLAERILNGYSSMLDADRIEALATIDRAQKIAPHDPFVLKMSGMVRAICGDADAAISALRHCVDLAPYDFGAWGYFGWPLAARANPADLEELHKIIDRLRRVAPEHPGIGYWMYHESAAYLCEDNLDSAFKFIGRALDKHPEVSWAWMHLASILGRQGESDEASNAAARAADINSSMTPSHYANCLLTMAAGSTSFNKRVSGLINAGLLND